MGRPEKFTAEYYPMYVKDGRTLTVLQHKFGLAGIGFFTNLMRILAATPHHYLNLSSEADRLYIASRIGCDQEEMTEFIETMLITKKLHNKLWHQYGVVYCSDLVDSLWMLYEKRKSKPKTVAEIFLEISGTETVPKDVISDSETPITGAKTHIEEYTREEYTRAEKNARVIEKHLDRQVDPVLAVYRDGIKALGLPTTAWTDVGNQYAALKDITERTQILAPDSAIPDPCDFARGILAVFKRRKETAKSDYWKKASPAPKVLQRRFDELVIGLGEEYDHERKEAESVEIVDSFLTG